MKIISPILVGLSLAVAGNMLAAAQQTDSMPASSVPKVLQITREFIKPGKTGAVHDRSESNFVQAMARAKWPTHYFAVTSLTGKSRALYLTGYDSFAAWQKDSDAVNKNSALAAELDRASMNDGELLDGFDQFVFTYDPDTSYRPNGDLTNARYLEVLSFHLKPGHEHEFTDIVKMVIDAHKKAGTSAHWATYEIAYGGDNEYVILSADKSMADIDTGFTENKAFMTAMGENGMKKLREMAASCVESSDSELFSINPKQSYPPDEWVKGSPEFWKPKPAMAPAANAAPTTKKTTP